jgi:integrase
VLAIPHKRTEKNLLTYLTEPEVDALLGACEQTTWTGRRDHTMLALTIQTGLRISELAALTRQDITLTTGANVHTIGKGRKARRTPLTPPIRAILKAWLRERAGAPDDPLFPSRTGKHLSRDAIEHRLAHHLQLAATCCPSIGDKHITMLRNSKRSKPQPAETPAQRRHPPPSRPSAPGRDHRCPETRQTRVDLPAGTRQTPTTAFTNTIAIAQHRRRPPEVTSERLPHDRG